MFEEGNILYFNPFYFENGNKPKPKYFLILKSMEDNLIIASLPTSHDHVPNSMEKKHGCIDDYTINFNCYYFQEGKNVAFNEKTVAISVFQKIHIFMDIEYLFLTRGNLMNNLLLLKQY